MNLDVIIDNITQKYRDAELLIDHCRYANAIYLCGYCVELALKYAIARNMNWSAFKPEGKLKFLKVHDFDLLIMLTGQETRIRKLPSWSIVNQWTEAQRYEDPTKTTQEDAQAMIAAAKQFVEELCLISL
ncbi:MAG: HEPN domain-containing protein [Candidatus Contendobacter sp.]|nr:HEPN domain-containing protein [Candidatus Contendobacter sp.]